MNTETLDEVDVERMIRSEAFISDTNGIPKDFFARSARRLLSSRDLLLCEAMNHRLPSGREQLLWGVGITAFTVLMLFIDGQEWRVLGMGLATAVFLSAGLLMMSSWTDPSAVRAGTFHAVLPVRVDEVVRATLKWTVLRCLCHAPLAIILGVWLAIEAGASYWDGITAGIVPLLTLIALRSSLTCISVSMDTNDTRYWRIYGVWGMFIFICFVGIPAALCGPASVAWSAFGVIGISSLAVVRYYARFISRRKVDFIRRPLH